MVAGAILAVGCRHTPRTIRGVTAVPTLSSQQRTAPSSIARIGEQVSPSYSVTASRTVSRDAVIFAAISWPSKRLRSRCSASRVGRVDSSARLRCMVQCR